MAGERVVGVGIDLVEIAEVEASIARRGRSFVARAFSPDEIAYCEARQRPGQHFAARLAAKEAAFKAAGTGWTGGVDWLDVEVRAAWGRRPELGVRGVLLARAAPLGVRRWHLSLTHAGGFAAAVVVACGDASGDAP
jgi:holo-[acyl-carrier protein] synthase